MISSRLVVAALVGWLFVGLLSAAPQFVQGPSTRWGHVMAYDSARNKVVLFGGRNSSNNSLGDTWEFDGVSWTLIVTANSPSARYDHAMTYDSVRGKVVMFGGYANDTWEYDGVDWNQIGTVSSPSARSEHAMSYDSGRGKIVMFGGYDGNWTNDTWEYDGVNWSQITTSNPPVTRFAHSMVYDAARGKIVMFGGYNGNSSNTDVLDDTWEYDGLDWAQVPNASGPSPVGRTNHGAAYDSLRARVVLFGGRDSSNNSLGDTWEFDGVGWVNLTPANSPSGRHGHAMVYDNARQECVVFGGVGGLDGTWAFDGAEWRPKLDYVTSPVNGNRYALTPSMTWPEAEALAVREGGHLATIRNAAENAWVSQMYGAAVNEAPYIGFSDAAVEGQWVWSSGESVSYTNWNTNDPNNFGPGQHYAVMLHPSGAWDDRCPSGGCVRQAVIELQGGATSEVAALVDTVLLPQPLRRAEAASLPSGGALSFGGDASCGPWAFTYEWGSSGWNKQFSTNNPMPRTGHSLILDEASQNNVLFGGVNPGGSKLSETWSYQGGQWTYLTPAHAPSARSEHAMAFDLASNVGVLFGGEDATGTLLNDMWAWDGIDWSQATPATLPPARAGHGLAYDRYRSRLVLFGGTDGSARLNDIWEWDGADWTQMTPAQPNGVAYGPSGRDGFVTAYDPRSERVVVIGGETDNGCVDEVWSWDGAGWLRHLPASGSTLPSARKDAAIFVDAATNDLRMFGGGCGSEFSDELWELQLPVFARSEVIGVGCLGSNGVPALSIANGTAPVLGAQMDFVYDNALNSIFVTPAIVAVGFDQGTYQGIPLPLSLAVIGLPGCTLYHSNDLSFSVGVAAGAAQFTWPLTIPNDTTLLGKDVFVQGLHLEFPGSASWAALSNTIGIRIGVQ